MDGDPTKKNNVDIVIKNFFPCFKGFIIPNQDKGE